MMPPPIEESVRWLKSLAVDDGLSLSDDELKTLLFRNGLSPGKALSTMRSQQIESRDLWRDTMGLLKAQDLMQAQDAIQKLAGYKQLAASTWLRLVELVLNEYYRQALLKPSLATKDPTCIGIWRRRQCLDKIRSLADRGRIALNYQMCVESIAYSGLGLGHDL
jgi:hypothetical protein